MESKERKILCLLIVGFLACYYLPVEAMQMSARLKHAVWESLYLVRWYAREHVLLCLVPAFFIAGAVGVFVSQASVMKYLGAGARKVVAYGVASVSGTILAVCSCTILPLFAGIYRMGAGLGPACTFLYSGPAINILAIALTARILGLELGIARAVGAVVFSIVIGLCMHFLFRNEEQEKARNQAQMPAPEGGRPLWQTALYFAAMIGILVFANWGAPQALVRVSQLDPQGKSQPLAVGYLLEETDAFLRVQVTEFGIMEAASGEELLVAKSEWQQDGARLEVEHVPTVWSIIHANKWRIAAGFGVLLGVALVLWYGLAWWKIVLLGVVVAGGAFAAPTLPLIPFVIGVVGLSAITLTHGGEMEEWFGSSWIFAKQILPLLLAGVLVAGFLLGRPESEGMIPSDWVARMVGGNSVWANLFASVAGAFMYFATLTEVPILQGLIGAGMGKGPALALLLAGPALSLPNMLVIRSVMGTKKTIAFVCLVIVMATISGLVFGAL